MSKLKFNKKSSQLFLKTLDPNAKEFSFQCFHPNKNKKKFPPQTYFGTLSEYYDVLCDHNKMGYGIYCTINQTKGMGRKLEDITGIRAVWVEDDNKDPDAKKLPIEPTMIVNTSGDNKHRYMCLAKTASTKKVPKEEFDKIKRTLVEKYGSDKSATDIARVLRVPGFYHTKEKGNWQLVTVDVSGGRYKWKKICKAIGYTNGDARKSLGGERDKVEFDPKKAWARETEMGDNPVMDILQAKNYFAQLRGLAFSYANKNVPRDTSMWLLQHLMETSKMTCSRELDMDDWQSKYDMIDNLVNTAYDKRGKEISDSIESELFTRHDAKTVDWLWKGFIPKGKVTIIAGDGGTGKTTLAIDLAARISRGDIPPYGTKKDKFETGKCCILTTEDDAADTIVPRFDVAGGEGGIFVWNTDDAIVDIKDGLIEFEEKVTRYPDLKMLIIDPITNFQGDIKGHNAGEISQVMGRLAGVAERCGIAIVCIMHVNKGDYGSLVDKVSGSKSYLNSVRSVMFCYYDGETDEDGNLKSESRFMGTIKSNISKPSGVIEYKISGVKYMEDENEVTRADLLNYFSDMNLNGFVAKKEAAKKNHGASGRKGKREERLIDGYKKVAEILLERVESGELEGVYATAPAIKRGKKGRKIKDGEVVKLKNKSGDLVPIMVTVIDFRKMVNQYSGFSDRGASVKEYIAMDKELGVVKLSGRAIHGYDAETLELIAGI